MSRGEKSARIMGKILIIVSKYIYYRLQDRAGGRSEHPGGGGGIEGNE